MATTNLIAGVSTGPVAAVLSMVFVLGGIWIASNGAGRWNPRLPMAYRIGGGLVVTAFGVALVIQALA